MYGIIYMYVWIMVILSQPIRTFFNTFPLTFIVSTRKGIIEEFLKGGKIKKYQLLS